MEQLQRHGNHSLTSMTSQLAWARLWPKNTSTHFATLMVLTSVPISQQCEKPGQRPLPKARPSQTLISDSWLSHRCQKTGILSLGHSTPTQPWQPSSPNSMGMMLYSHATVNLLPHRQSKHSLPCRALALMPFAQTLYVITSGTPSRGASNLGEEWRVSTQIGGRRRERGLL